MTKLSKNKNNIFYILIENIFNQSQESIVVPFRAFFYESSNHRKNLWDRVDKYHIDTISDLGFVSVKLLKKTTLCHHLFLQCM